MKRMLMLLLASLITIGFVFSEGTEELKNGISFSIIDLASLKVGSYGGEINYTRKTTDVNRFRIGVSGGFNTSSSTQGDNTAKQDLFNLGLNADYIFFPGQGIIKPYFGFGFKGKYSYLSAVDLSSGNYMDSHEFNIIGDVPFGIEFEATKYFTISLESNFNIFYSQRIQSYNNQSIQNIGVDFSSPSVVFSFWF